MDARHYVRLPVRFRLVLPALAALAALAIAAPSGAATGRPMLVRLTAGSACAESAGLAAAGAREIDAKLRLWRLDGRTATMLLPGLRARDAVTFAQREQSYRVAATTDTPEPLQGDEWWLAQIGLEGVTPPGPGSPSRSSTPGSTSRTRSSRGARTRSR